ncbi:MAG: MBL fold metallo-hydrolase [Bacteroidetes bacterium]|nr:MBL fold metallo-hydrolase [Bacteroidota bacterium]MCL5026920.1 MBL fold metallo-hydrolase [Chloroflexota bacterium]
MEVLPGVHQVRYPLTEPGVWVALDLIVDTEATLIDTGLPATPQDLLVPYFAKIALPANRITTIVNTHFHGDHAGGNAELRALTGARLMAHRLEVPFIENPQAGMQHYLTEYPGYYAYEGRTEAELLSRLPKPAKVDRVLDDGEELKLSGRTFQVVHTPGHTAGSISLFDRQRGELYCGDALQAEGTLNSLAYYHDVDAYLSSLAKVEALEVRAMMPAHGYRPFTEALLRGSQVKDYLRVCREATARYDEQIMEVLHKAAGPLTLGQVTAGVRAFYNMEGWNFTSIAPVRAHLDRLKASGAVVRSEGYNEALWSAA